MLGLDLNSVDTTQGAVSIFNNGVAGRVKNVKVTIEPKGNDDFGNSPDVKIWFEDQEGHKCNTGWYRFTPDDRIDENANKKRLKNNMITLLAVVKALAPEDFQFQDVTQLNQKQVEDYLITTLTQLQGQRLVNVFVCYGFTGKPSQYIGTRKFNFIERAEVTDEETTLKPANTDVMERMEPTPKQGGDDASGFGGGAAFGGGGFGATPTQGAGSEQKGGFFG